MTQFFRVNPRHWFGLVVIATCVYLLGCQGDEGPNNPEPPAPTVVTLSDASASSGTRLEITGLPADITGIYGVVTPAISTAKVDSTNATGFAYIVSAPDEKNYLIAPLHPATPKTGGPVSITFVGGDKITSVPVTLNLEPLAEAPGAFGDLVDSQQLLLDGWLGQLGTTRQALRDAAVADLSFMEITTLFVHNVVDNPDNPNSLRAMADGDIPAFEGLEFDRELLDSITALSNLQSMVEEKLVFVGELEPLTSAAKTSAVGVASSKESKAECIEPPDFDIGPDDCALLAEIMSYQANLEAAHATATNRYQNDLVNATLTAASAAGAGAVATGVGVSFWAIDSIEQGQRGMYPSQFINEFTDFQLDVTDFPEDFSSPGRWSEFRVSAASEGWRFDDKIFEAFQKMVGAGRGLGGGEIGSLADLAASLEGSIKGGPNALLKSKLLENNPGKLEYCPRTWTNIDCTGMPFSSGSSNSLIYDSDELTYEPVETGSATLLVETMPIFGPANITGETKVIETGELGVFVDPFQATLDVTTQKQFVARVDNAENQQVSWSITGAIMADTPTTANVTTPDLPWQTPIVLTAKSLANTGLRTGLVDSEPRTKTVLITYGGEVGITIEPQNICLSPGEPQLFTASVIGLTDYELVWSLGPESQGTIDPTSGMYEAMEFQVGLDQVDVAIVGLPEVNDSTTVRVGACDCNFTFLASGASSYNAEGHVAYHLLVATTEDLLIQWNFVDPATNGTFIPLEASVYGDSDNPGPRPGDTGIWPINAIYSEPGGIDVWFAASDEESPTLFVNITEFTAGQMIGTIYGQCVQRDDPQDSDAITSSVTINLEFQSSSWVLGERIPCRD